MTTATKTTTTTITTARSVYVSRLRRAFLLRVHPDRFRNYDDEQIKQNQASLVKALMNRMNQHDFVAWQQHHQLHHHHHQSLFSNTTTMYTSSNHQHQPNNNNSNNNTKSTTTMTYCIEKRDGTLLSTQLNLSDPVDDILKEMSRALVASGASAPTAPPSYSLLPPQQQKLLNKKPETNNIFYANTTTKTTGDDHKVDHRYDIVSKRGRDLKTFLRNDGDDVHATKKSSLADMINERRLHRMDAQAVALSVRNAFKFQSVDAVPSGWSSASVSVLLRRLLDLHNDYSSQKFQVRSFYPLRLVFTPTDVGEEISYQYHDDGNNHTNPKNNDTSRPLDIHGGIVRLHPACTSQQWLRTLQLISPETLDSVKHHRIVATERTKMVAATLGIQLRKGHSCSSYEYHAFLQRLAPITTPTTENNNNNNNNKHNDVTSLSSSTSNSIVLQPDLLVVATVESSYAIRRPSVTTEGQIRLGANMDVHTCRNAVEQLLPKARALTAQYQTQQRQCQQMIHQIQNMVGLQKIYRSSPFVTQEQYYHSLQRILKLLVDDRQAAFQQRNVVGDHDHDLHDDDDDDEELYILMKHKFAGNSLGITGDGQFCHLADDGSIVIPYNWM